MPSPPGSPSFYGIDHMDAGARLHAVRALLQANGCECEDDCERCLACRVSEAMSND